MAQLIDIKKDFDLGNKFLLDVAENLAHSLDDDFRVIIKYDLQDYNIPNDNKKNIIFALSRETHDVPRYVEDERVFLVFQNYALLDQWDYPIDNAKIFPLPLGSFINGIGSKIEEIKPFAEREYDFCFVGQLPHTGTRDMFKRCLDKMLEETKNKYKSYVTYTKNFGAGLNHDEYVELLNNSKICLCPSGAFSSETFRFFEAISLGAFPMVERLPRFWYYQDAPMFFCRWQFLDKYLAEALNFLNSSKDLAPFQALANYNEVILEPVSLSQILKRIIDEKQQYSDQLQNSFQSA